MRILLDTHVLIYLGSDRTDLLSKAALAAYKHPENEIFISQISYWEMAIKINIGKLNIPIDLAALISASREAGIQVLPLENKHILNYIPLPILPTHKDPFDRFLIATALSEKMAVISSDTQFKAYQGLDLIW